MLGYNDVKKTKLVFLFGNKPYVDVRADFNAFIPASIPKELKIKLVNFFLAKLKDKPHLQDKAEFEILFTCYDFSIDKRLVELIPAGFNRAEINLLKSGLIHLTNKLLDLSIIEKNMEINRQMESDRKKFTTKMSSSPQKKLFQQNIYLRFVNKKVPCPLRKLRVSHLSVK